MNYRKFRKNMKAISPIISVLLMIAIAVVASLVVYAWVMGYIGYQTGKTGDQVVIQSVTWENTTGTNPTTTTLYHVYLQNIGTTTITLTPGSFLYVNGILDTAATSKMTIPPGTTVTILAGQTTPPANTVPGYNLTPGTQVTIKVTTLGGTYSQVTEQVPGPRQWFA